MFLPAYVWVALLLPVWAALMAPPLRPTTSSTSTITAAEIGLLRAGTLGALGTAATELYVDDLVTVDRRKLVRGPGHMHTGVSPLGQAVYSAVTRRASLRRLQVTGDVRAAVSQLRKRLVEEGLVPGRMRWLLARTILLALATTSVLELVTGPSTGLAGLLCLIVLLAVGVASLVPRRTIAGKRRLAALLSGKGEVMVSAHERGHAWAVRNKPAVAFALDGRVLPALVAVMRVDLFTRMRSALLARLSYERTPDVYTGWDLESVWHGTPGSHFHFPGQAGGSAPSGMHGAPGGAGGGPSGGHGSGPGGAGGGSGPARFQ